jgi:hypothetical protein
MRRRQCTSQLAAFFAQGPRRDCRSLAILIRPTTHLINFHALGEIIQLKEYNNSNAIIHKKKRLPTKVGQTAHDHPALCHGLFVCPHHPHAYV